MLTVSLSACDPKRKFQLRLYDVGFAQVDANWHQFMQSIRGVRTRPQIGRVNAKSV